MNRIESPTRDKADQFRVSKPVAVRADQDPSREAIPRATRASCREKPVIRIIPRLDIKGPNLVKGINMEGLRVLGKPWQFAQYYYEHGADELIYMDAVASLYGRNSLTEIVEKTSREIFIPLTVGGGLRSLDDIREILRAGADKVALNTAAMNNPELIRDASRAFGSSTIVVSIEAIRRRDGLYEAFTDYGRQDTGVDAIEWAKKTEELGAGELLVTSIDREGTGRGYELDLIRRIAESVSIPVIASGGAGRIQDIYDVILHGKADAVGMASIIHYHSYRHLHPSESDFSCEGNIEFLNGRKANHLLTRIEHAGIDEIKAYLSRQGIACRTNRQDTHESR